MYSVYIASSRGSYIAPLWPRHHHILGAKMFEEILDHHELLKEDMPVGPRFCSSISGRASPLA